MAANNSQLYQGPGRRKQTFEPTLGNLTPILVYQTASGGGARIVDKFKEQKTFSGVRLTA
jgi:hypothetical protein